MGFLLWFHQFYSSLIWLEDKFKIIFILIYTHELDPNILAFSDVCRKLLLNSIVSEDCWTEFVNDKSSLTKAKKMCHAIYQILQNKAILYDEKSIQEIVYNSLGVKTTSNQKGIIFKAFDFSPAFDSQETKRRFYMNLFVQRHKKKMISQMYPLLGEILKNT